MSYELNFFPAIANLRFRDGRKVRNVPKYELLVGRWLTASFVLKFCAKFLK